MKEIIKKFVQEQLIEHLTVIECNNFSEKLYKLVNNFEFIDDGQKWRTTFQTYYKEVLQAKDRLLQDKQALKEIHELYPIIDLKKTLDNIQKNSLCTKRNFERLRVLDVDFDRIYTDYIFRNEYVVNNLEKMAVGITDILKEVCWCKNTEICSNVCSKCEHLKVLQHFIIKKYESKSNKNTKKV